MYFATPSARIGRLSGAGLKRAALAAVVAVAAFAAPFAARALDEAGARDHVAAVFDRLVDIAVSGSNSSGQTAAFRTVILEDIAYRDMARLSMGRTWRAMSDDQKDRFRTAFVDYTSASYSSAFEDFNGERLEVGDVVDSNDREVLIASAVVSPGNREPIEVIWRVIDDGGAPKVLDVYIERVSLLETLRNEFEAMLERNGDDIDALIVEIAR